MLVTIRLEDVSQNLRTHLVRKMQDPAELAQLADHEDFNVVTAVALNPNTPDNILTKLALDENSANPCPSG